MTAYVFCAGEYPEGRPEVPAGSFVIAADAGLDALRRFGIRPDLIVGDFDSLRGELPGDVEVIRHPVMKDDTDSALAVAEARRRGAGQIWLCGALGGRLDHCYANLSLAAAAARCGCPVFMPGRGVSALALGEGSALFPEGARGRLSLFAAGGGAVVTERGLKYSLSERAVPEGVTLGVSNEFTGVPAEIIVRSGAVLIMWDADNPFPEIRRD